MDCPVCHEPLVILEYAQVEVDYCTVCRGLWLDAGELELLFGDAGACASFLAGDRVTLIRPEAPRRCPVCGKTMRKASTAGATPVTYDQCPRGDGLWLDEGELAAILRQGPAPEGGRLVADFLREVFEGGPGRFDEPEGR